jgi:hypothetical protein
LFKAGESDSQLLFHQPKSLASFRLDKMENKRHHSNQYQENAHQIIEDFRKNHYDNTKDKADYSSNDSQSR